MDEVLVQPKLEMLETWTIEDVRALDVEDWRRYELVDGSLAVSPPPGLTHERVSAGAREIIRRALPSLLTVIGPVGVALPGSYRIPDLVVTQRSLMRSGEYLAAVDVVLVVEVVSPGSETTDRVTKPAQYAAAGIENYWRVETDPVSLTAYRLADGVYDEVGAWTDGQATLSEPFAVELDLAELG